MDSMLNKKLKFFRTSYKMTQETLALKLGVTRQTVSKWEKGISVPDADVLVKIADIFGVSVSELLGENNKNEDKKLDDSHVSEVLSVINHQLSIKNKHHKIIMKVVRIVLIVIAILIFIPILYTLFWMYVAATM